MANDEADVIYDVLNDNWNAETVTEPKYYFDDTIRDHDYRGKDAIKIYWVDQIDVPVGLGYTSKYTETRVTIDVRSASRTTILKLRDEIIRCLDYKRKAPAAGYDFLTHDGGTKHGYSNFFRFTIDCKLTQYAKTIS